MLRRVDSWTRTLRHAKPSSSESVRLVVERLSHEGRGVVRPGGKVGFVAGALPGESIEARLVERHRRFDEYRLLDVVEASPRRVTPACPIVERCGGCDLQHLDHDAQLDHKTAVLRELMSRTAGLEPAVPEAPLRSPPFGYRRRARLAWHVPRRGAPRLGFRQAGSREIVALEACPVLDPVLASLPGRLQPVLASLRRPRQLGHVELTVSESGDGRTWPVLYLHLVEALAAEDRARVAGFAAAEGAYLYLGLADRRAECAYRPEPQAPGYLLPESGLRLTFEPGDFLQGNAAVNRAMVRRVVEWLSGDGVRRVVDAFCGLGNFALPLAAAGLAVEGYEGDAALVDRARRNAADLGLDDRARFSVRDLDADAGLPDGVDAVLLDPPRTGAAALAAALAARPVPVVAYVSCAPATLTRDAAVLAGAGYRLERLAAVDMFPQTAHIEAMALFTR